MARTKKIIQQWQFLGKVHPKMLEDEAFRRCREAGITSLQSYFFWKEIEKEPGVIDFSSYDPLLEKLRKYDLKWVPFFILGPNYATPDWFKKTERSVFAKCLEHGKESKIQSIWNPFLPAAVDRYLRILSEHYRDKNILESICLGISGIWGESIYPAKGDFHENFHTHIGWWCADKYALHSFQKNILQKYGSMDKANNAWGTGFSKKEEIDFPDLRYSFSSTRQIYNLIPSFLKPVLKSAYIFLKNYSKKETDDSAFGRRWLDFVDWYASSMTSWAEFWLKTARKYFPENEIYLVCGGNGNPMLGADFSGQAKMAAKYNAGIRITNQTNYYSQNFALNRLISSACRFYGSYFTTEEGMINKPESLPMRLFDTIASGARGFYCKNIIGTGEDICSKKSFAPGIPTQGAEILSENIHFLKADEKPVVQAAIFFPNNAVTFEPAILDSVYKQYAELRDVLDFDLADENMLKDGVLKNYKFFAVLEGSPLSKTVAAQIGRWVKSGGVLISPKSADIFPGGNGGPKKIDKGYAIIYSGKGEKCLEFIKKAVYNKKKDFPWAGIPVIDEVRDRVYITRFSDKIIYYNANDFEVRKRVELEGFPLKFINIKGNSITSINL